MNLLASLTVFKSDEKEPEGIMEDVGCLQDTGRLTRRIGNSLVNVSVALGLYLASNTAKWKFGKHDH